MQKDVNSTKSEGNSESMTKKGHKKFWRMKPKFVGKSFIKFSETVKYTGNRGKSETSETGGMHQWPREMDTSPFVCLFSADYSKICSLSGGVLSQISTSSVSPDSMTNWLLNKLYIII